MEQGVSGLTLTEKIRLLSGRDMWCLEAVSSAGIPSVMMADGPHGIRKQPGVSDTMGLFPSLPATCFPPAVTLASSWDMGLAEEVGAAIGREARAQGIGVVLGPGLNLKRHPCAGRNFEYLSEDPLLSGKMAAAFVRGVQSVGVGACVKHFAVNDQETRRMTVDVIVDERTLRELYLSGFEIVVREARPWTVMCAYNRVNGEYCSDSRRLLTEILRDEWGFDGLVMSDWGATNDRVAALVAGMDLEMPSSDGVNDVVLADAGASGVLAEEVLNRSVARVVGLARRAAAALESPPLAVDYDAHHALARRVAAESAVLLTNDGTLPLAGSERIAVIGAFADEPRYQGTGSSRVAPTRLDTALGALRARAGGEAARITYDAGYDPACGSTTAELLAAAAASAAQADVALVFAGLPVSYESEGLDREHMRLPAGHEQLIEAVCDVNPRTVVVLFNGAPVEMEWAARPAAILEAYLGGQAGGSAVADVLFGDADPGGRLAETFPLVQSDVPADENFPGSPAQVEYREARNVGYRYFQTAGVAVRFPFGHGLSYTEFTFGAPALTATRIEAGQPLGITMEVRNSGARAGSTVVQAYVRPMAPSAVRASGGELAVFAKVRLKPGESTQVALELDGRAFAFYDVASAAWQTEAGEYEIALATSAEEVRHRAVVTIESAFVPGKVPALPVRVAGDAEFRALLGRPVPQPRPVLPYDRTTAVDDLRATRLGRMVRRVLVIIGKRRSAHGLAESDPVAAAMLKRFVAEMPLRSVATMSHGRLTWRRLDALIAMLNGRWGHAFRQLIGRPSKRRTERPL